MDFWILVVDPQEQDEAAAFLIREVESVEAAIALAVQKVAVETWQGEGEHEGEWDTTIRLSNFTAPENVIVFDEGGKIIPVNLNAALNVEVGEKDQASSQ